MPASIQRAPMMRAPSWKSTTLSQTEHRQDNAEHRRQRHPRAADRHRQRHAERARPVALAEAQDDHRQVGERERDHRAEGEHPGQELEVVRQWRARTRSARPADRHVRRAAAAVEAAHSARDLPVGGERVGQPRQPEHLAVHAPRAASPRRSRPRRSGRVEQEARLVARTRSPAPARRCSARRGPCGRPRPAPPSAPRSRRTTNSSERRGRPTPSPRAQAAAADAHLARRARMPPRPRSPPPSRCRGEDRGPPSVGVEPSSTELRDRRRGPSTARSRSATPRAAGRC